MRCPRCALLAARCICGDIPTVATRTRIVIVRHVLERWRPSNTARLAALALPGCEIVDHGAHGAPAPAALDGPGTWLLYPGASGAAVAPGAPARLVVLDGSWPQTRRMTQRIPALARMPRLSLPPPARPAARMRRAPRAECMATLEAIARALELLEGPAVARPLDALFAEVVRRSRAG